MHRAVALLAVAALALPQAALAKDLRTAMIRLVPETDWKPTPGPVAVAVESTATHEDAAELTKEFDKWVRWAFPELDYTLDDQAPTRVKFVIEEVDPGNAGLRWTIGFGAGKSYIRGSILVEVGGQATARLAFTGRPKSASMDGMAKELAPAVVLKLNGGERDAELHEPNPKEEDKEKEKDEKK